MVIKSNDRLSHQTVQIIIIIILYSQNVLACRFQFLYILISNCHTIQMYY